MKHIILYSTVILMIYSCAMKKKRYKPDNFFGDQRYLNIAEAIYYGNGGLLKDYLERYKDLDIDKLGKRGAGLLMYSVIVRERKMTKMLLEHGADPNKVSNIIPYREPIKENSTGLCTLPLGFICEHYHRYGYNKKYAELLIKYGANVNDTTCYEPPFILALSTLNMKEKKEIFSILLENGADINIQNKYGDTPLTSATGGTFCWDTIEWLLDHGADYKITDHHNISVVHRIQDYLELHSDSRQKYLDPPQRLKRRLEAEGVIFPKGPFFPIKQGEPLPDIEYRK